MPIVVNFVYIFKTISVEKGLNIPNKQKIATGKIWKVRNKLIMTSFARFHNLPLSLYIVIGDVADQLTKSEITFFLKQ